MSNREVGVYALTGFVVWLHGAVAFYFGGRFLFEHGPLAIVAVGVAVAVLVCMALRFTMAWRKGRPSDAVTIAVAMAAPGLFGEAVRQVVFTWATGLPVTYAPSFAAVIVFGNAALLTYAMVVARQANRR